MPVESPIDAVDRHGAQSADQTNQQASAQGSRRRERQRTPGEGGDPALVWVRRGDDGVKLVSSFRRRHLARADTTDQAVDGRQSAEVHRPGLHDVQRAGRRRRRPAVCGDVDRRVDDVDLATLDAVRGGDGRHLVHRGGRRQFRTPSGWHRYSRPDRAPRPRARRKSRRARCAPDSLSAAGYPSVARFPERFGSRSRDDVPATAGPRDHGSTPQHSPPVTSTDSHVATSKRRRWFRLSPRASGVFAHIRQEPRPSRRLRRSALQALDSGSAWTQRR